MKNLHNIRYTPNLTDDELSVIYYCQEGYESNWEFKMIENTLHCKRKFETNWEKVTGRWACKYTMKIWYNDGKIMPDLSVVQ